MTAATFKAAHLADQVVEESRNTDLLKVLLTVLFVVPFTLGWVAGALCTGLAWMWTAVVVGWRTARPTLKR